MRFCAKFYGHVSGGKFLPAVGLLQLLGRLSPPRKLAEAAPPHTMASPGSVKLARPFLSDAHFPAFGVGHHRQNRPLVRYSETPVLSGLKDQMIKDPDGSMAFL